MCFISGLQMVGGFYKGFDEELGTALLGHAIIYTKEDIRCMFELGNEVKIIE